MFRAWVKREVRGDVHLGRLTLAGALRVVAGEGATLHVPQLEAGRLGGILGTVAWLLLGNILTCLLIAV